MTEAQIRSLELMDEHLNTIPSDVFLDEYEQLEQHIGPTIEEFQLQLSQGIRNVRFKRFGLGG